MTFAQERFWEVEGSRVPPSALVFAVTGQVKPTDLCDARLRPIPNLRAPGSAAALFFVDLAPGANWAHPCRYVFVDEDGDTYETDHDWPPASQFELYPIYR